MDAWDRLGRFERDADAAIAAMPIAGLPARAMLTGIHYFLYTVAHAGLLGLRAQPGVAESIATRMGNLVPVVERCAGEPFGQSGRDAVDAFLEADPDGSQLAELLAYAHFSDFMPEAHKGYYEVSHEGGTFRLQHPDAAFAEAQARDILLSELALVFPLTAEEELDPVLHEIARTAPKIDWNLLGPLLQKKAKRLVLGLAESNLLAEAGIERVFGFGYKSFYLIRAALLAYAEFALQLSMVLGATSNRAHGGGGISNETLEWVSVNHKADFFVAMIAKQAGAEIDAVERFLAFYSIDFRHAPARHHGGDGFFPPFARFAESFAFSPILVLSTLHIRNAVFAFSSRDRKSFDNHVSAELEPVLVRQAGELLRRSHAWTLKTGLKYAGGEIDLVVAADAGAVLLIQAKGTLPPQGSRLTERLADRIREGIGQVERFRALPPAEQERIVSAAVGRKVAHTDIRHGVLARACFGAPEMFDPALDVGRLTLPLLSLALGEMRGAADPADVDTLLLRLQAVELRYYVDAEPRWEEGDIALAGARLQMPLFKYDERLVDAVRRLAWYYSMIAEPSPGHADGAAD